MGRRGDHSFEQLNEMIIGAAYSLIEKEGLANASTRKVAAQIGYTVGTLYNVFRNFDDILVHINSRTLDNLNASLNEALEKSNGENTLKSLANAYLAFSIDNFNLWSMLFEYRFPETHQMPKWYIEKINSIYIPLTNSIKTQFPKMSDKDLQTNMAIIWAAVHGICALQIKGKLDKVGAESAQMLISNFLDTYSDGLKKRFA